jgi:hypothetical protein
VLSVGTDATTIETSSDLLRVKDNGVSNAKLRQSSGLSLIGRSANSTGNVADITSSVDGHVLRQSGTAIGFGTVATAGIADGAITQAKRASLGQQVSSSSGTYTTTSTSYIDVTNLSVTITTTGRPVYVGLIPAGGTGCYFGASNTASGVVSALAKIVRDSTDIGIYLIGSGATGASWYSENNLCTSIFTIDVIAAGTYTYKVSVRLSIGSYTTIADSKLIAYEL